MTGKVKVNVNFKGASMKRQIITLAVLAALLITPLASAVAGINAPDLKAEIPFDFVVGTKMLPAGDYKISMTYTPGLVKIQSTDGKSSTMVLTRLNRNNKVNVGSRLLFRRYGRNYFLGSIYTDGRETDHQVPASKAERKAADDAKFLAGRQVQPGIVYVDIK